MFLYFDTMPKNLIKKFSKNKEKKFKFGNFKFPDYEELKWNNYK